MPIDSRNSWQEAASPEQLATYYKLLREASGRKIQFAIGGSLAMTAYAGTLRPTKDLDLYVMLEDKDRMVSLLGELGFRDYYDQLPYDRGWIYRGTTGEVIVDIIWQMANRRAMVDSCWLSRGRMIQFGEESVRVVPIEEMIWSKLYVFQRDRCDWPDILNLIDSATDQIDWSWLAQRLGDDLVLLSAIMRVYSWLRPEARSQIPPWLWDGGPNGNGFGDAQIEDRAIEDQTRKRAALIDSRPWFLQTVKENR